MLCIQDPSYEVSKYLHEVLLSECVGSLYGAGAYAFASKDGIDLLFADESFKTFLETGTYTLLVGTDDITNENAIKELQVLKNKYGSHLHIKAYVHDAKGSTFHPKFSWFKKNDGGTLIIGSGNLTLKGLRHNREAYCINNYNEDEMKAVISEWNNWLAHSAPFLFEIDDPIVLEKAKRNTVEICAVSAAKKAVKEKSKQDGISLAEVYKNQPQNYFLPNTKSSKKSVATEDGTALDENKQISQVITDEEVDVDSSYWLINSKSAVLIAEIPKSGNRWKQANFDKASFENYFGATCGENGEYRILLKNVKNDGSLGETEIRPSVSVSSQNYRFELDAANGLAYPNGKERPIVIFAKVSCRDFMYELLMPGEKNYNEVMNFIGKTLPPSGKKMRRLQYNANEVFAEIPNLALQKRLEKDGF